MFTELSEMKANGNREDFKSSIINGTRQIVFLTTPFALYLIVFAIPLVTLYHAGAFTEENIFQVSYYLTALALSLPFYGVNTYLQKIFSALRQMKRFAVINIFCALIQIGFTLLFGTVIMADTNYALEAVALGESVFFICSDIICFLYLRKRYGSFGIRHVVVTFVRSLALGLLGAAVGWLILYLLQTFFGTYYGSIWRAFVYTVIAGVPAVVVTFGLAIKLNLPGAKFIADTVHAITGKFKAKLHRG